MSYIIVEEYLDGKLVRIARIDKEDIRNIEEIKHSKEIASAAIKDISKINKELKEKLKEELKKSEYEISEIVNRPTYEKISRLVNGLINYIAREREGYKTIIDFKEGGLYLRISMETIKKALKSDKNIRIKVFMKKEEEKYVVEKEEIEELS